MIYLIALELICEMWYEFDHAELVVQDLLQTVSGVTGSLEKALLACFSISFRRAKPNMVLRDVLQPVI